MAGLSWVVKQMMLKGFELKTEEEDFKEYPVWQCRVKNLEKNYTEILSQKSMTCQYHMYAPEINLSHCGKTREDLEFISTLDATAIPL